MKILITCRHNANNGILFPKIFRIENKTFRSSPIGNQVNIPQKFKRPKNIFVALIFGFTFEYAKTGD